MKKNEYVAPEMEIVEITELCCILAGSNTESPDDDIHDGLPIG